MNQIDLHNRIDQLFKNGPDNTQVPDFISIIGINEDAKRYFFLKADESWLDWLWKNGLLNAIKSKKLDGSPYRMPELDYLASVSEKIPDQVTDIILEIGSEPNNFNIEVISRFLWISSSLPGEQISRLVPKIKSENWVRLMNKSNNWGFEYEKMIEKLISIGDYNNLLSLVDVILSTRTKKEIHEMSNGYTSDNPFYFNDLGQIKLFKIFSEVPEQYAEQALELASIKMKEVILLADKESETEIFDVSEQFFLFDVDFYDLDVDSGHHHSQRDDIRDLAAVIKKLSERVIGTKCSEESNALRLYSKYINSLPLSRSMWRLRLFVVSLCPQAFKELIKEYLFKVFNYEKSLELVSGAEYEQLLKKCFSVLESDDQKEYIKQVLTFFGNPKKEKFYKAHGLDILSCIKSYLDSAKIAEYEQIFGAKIQDNHKPQPSISRVTSGFISSKAPIDLATLKSIKVEDIPGKLKNDWNPQKLYEMDTVKDFLNPLNAEGMGMIMQQDLVERFPDYVKNANLFFDRNNLDSHYTYSFLQGIYNILRENKYPTGVDYFNLIALLESLVASDMSNKFVIEKRDRDIYNAWLANWNAVFSSAADVLKELLGENKNEELINFPEFRDKLLVIIKDLILFPDPDLEDNTRENGADPFGTAINSVRGKAFQALIFFAQKEDTKFNKTDKVKISTDVKKLYEDLLEGENTYAVMFEYGHYLANFYYRDRDWIKGLLNKIFPSDTDKHDLLIASLEGHFCNSLYGELFTDLSGVYEIAIKMTPDRYTKRRYFKDIDEGLATHIALAFAYFPTFDFEHPLYKLFWSTPNTKRQKEFISFIGRSIISKEKAKDFIAKNKIDIERLKGFWDWAINNIADQEVLSGFGFWMNTKEGVLDKVWVSERAYKTLEKSQGKLDWEYGLMKSIVELATLAPENTLKILKLYLDSRYITKSLDGFPHSIYVDREIFDSLKTLYQVPSIRDDVYSLINDLLPVGSGLFWKLKEIIK
ncbi:MAG: hypothetical protein M0Q94_06560 [Candidatus Cloacimonetes bacterium]|nr:hypothetical protein [Candidatus Cloacimonadota bacterium]